MSQKTRDHSMPAVFLLLISACLLLSSCSILPTSGTKQYVYTEQKKASIGTRNEKELLKKLSTNGFTEGTTYQNTAATHFSVTEYKKYGKTLYLLVIEGNQNYLICPFDFSTDEVKKDFGDELTIIDQGHGNIYLAATACGSFFRACNAIDDIGFSSIRPADWSISQLKDAMDNKQIRFAGKYSAPDYERLTDGKASLAIESTMILHTPAVREKLLKLGIPVMIDYSSYESTPEARLEWVKVYGIITGHKNEAFRFFNEKYKNIEKVNQLEKTGKSVAYFSLDAENNVVVRSGSDYIPAMIERAGGEYAFPDLRNPDSDSHSPTVNLSFEDFYKTARDTDIMIINTTIEGSIGSLSALTDRNSLFSDMKAVRDGNVYETSADIYQSADESDQIINDMHRIIKGKKAKKYFKRLD